MRGARGTLATIGALALAIVAAPSAAAETPTRAEYVAQVEPICEANTLANKRILRNVRVKARDGRMKEAGAQFTHAAAAFGSTVNKLVAVPRPPEDEPRLLRWIEQLRVVQTKLRKLGKALKAEDEILAAHEAIRVERASNAANNIGHVFEFRDCRITPSRFS